MRQDESEYWDKMADMRIIDGQIRDNIWKRAAIVHRLFRLDWCRHRVLEIGVGFGVAAAAMKLVYLNSLEYTGTDVSEKFCDRAKKYFELNVVHTDILNLPEIEEGFTRIIALDSLEHVRPEDREFGYENIGKVSAANSIMVINMPLNESYHDEKYDHPFGIKDIERLCSISGFEMVSFEKYMVSPPSGPAFYGWAILKKGKG